MKTTTRSTQATDKLRTLTVGKSVVVPKTSAGLQKSLTARANRLGIKIASRTTKDGKLKIHRIE